MTSPIMTKQVNTTFATPVSLDWGSATMVKIQQMIAEGNSIDFTSTPGVRRFVDQAAAEEWMAFVTDLSATLNRPIISLSISDI